MWEQLEQLTSPQQEVLDATKEELAALADEFPFFPEEENMRTTVVDFAQDVLESRGHLPYRRGGGSPQSGFDCSGFVQYVFRKHEVAIPRTAAGMYQELLDFAQKKPINEAKPGDIVFFKDKKRGIYHVELLATAIENWKFTSIWSTQTAEWKATEFINSQWTSSKDTPGLGKRRRSLEHDAREYVILSPYFKSVVNKRTKWSESDS